MQDSMVDPKLVEEFLSFTKNVPEAPKLVPAPDEISLESTPYDVVFEQDKMRLLHYKSIVEKQIKTPLLIIYAIINRFHILDIQPKEKLGQKTLGIRNRCLYDRLGNTIKH